MLYVNGTDSVNVNVVDSNSYNTTQHTLHTVKRSRIRPAIDVVCRQLLSLTPEQLDLRLLNNTVHNMSKRQLTRVERNALACGLNFVLRPSDATNDTLLQQYTQFARSIRIRYYFAQRDNNMHSNPILRIKNPSYQPPAASPAVEQYLSTVKQRLMTQLSNCPADERPHTNIPGSWLRALRSLQRDKTIVIKAADKNLGPCIMDADWYKKEAFRQLNDHSTYTPLEQAPCLKLVYRILVNVLEKYNVRWLITTNWKGEQCKRLTKLARYLLQLSDMVTLPNKPDIRQTCIFYLLPKLHKTPVVGRPIVSSVNYVTYHASRWLDYMLQPIMKASPSYIKDSRDMVRLIETTSFNSFNSSPVLVAIDVVSLYPSIPTINGIGKVCSAIRRYQTKLKQEQRQMTSTQQRQFTPPLLQYKVGFIVSVLKWVLLNNIVEFDKHVYKQIQGTAMGTPVAVAYANIFLSELERSLMNMPSTPTPLLFKRFVDDGFGVFRNAHDANKFVSNYNALQSTINLTKEVGDEVSFLDLVVYRGERYNKSKRLDIKLHQKQLNSYLYLPIYTFHPPHSKTSFIIGELQRYCRNSSNIEYFSNSKALFRQRLMSRGYPIPLINYCFKLVNYKQRQSLIFNQSRRSSTVAPIVFKTMYTHRHRSLNLGACLTLTNGIYSDPTAAQVLQKRPTIAYRRHSNIGEMLVRARFNSVVDHNSSICHTTDVNDNSTNTRSHDVNDVHDHLTNHTSG